MNAIACLVGIAAVGIAARDITATYNNGDLKLRSGRFVSRQLDNGRVQYTLIGSANSPTLVTSTSANSRFETPGTLEVVTASAGNQRIRIDSAQTAQGITYQRSSDAGSTTVTGTGALYQYGSPEATFTVNANVVILNNDATARQVTRITGSRLTARIEPLESAKGDSAIRYATLTGPVAINARMASGQTYQATGSRAELNNRVSPPTLTLADNIRIISSGENQGTVEGVNRLVMTLNAKGEVTSVEMSGEPMTTTIRPRTGSGSAER